MSCSIRILVVPCAATLAALVLLPALPAVAGESLRLDADDAARMAVEASHLATAAGARLSGAEADVRAADAARLPTVDASAALAYRSSVPELSVPLGGPGSTPTTIFPDIRTTAMAELSVSQPLYTGGAVAGGRTAARLGRDATAADRDRTLADVRLAARSAYWRAVAAEAGVVAATAQQTRAQRLLDDARSLREAGMAVPADVLAAQARVASAQVAVIRAGTAARDALATLRSLLGRPPGVELVLADRDTEAVPPSPAALEPLVDEATAARPELRAADARIAALDARRQVVEAGRRPTVAATGSYDIARPNARYLPLEDAWNDSWSVGVSARWTVFDGDRVDARSAAVHAEQDAARADRAELARQVALGVESARLELEAALQAVPAADAARDAAAAREQASEERYAAGLAPIQERLDAQAELAAAEVEQIQTRASAWIARAALDRAVGR